MGIIAKTFGMMAAGVEEILAPRTCYLCGTHLAANERFLCLGCYTSLPRTDYHRNPTNDFQKRFLHLRHPLRAAAWCHYRHDSELSRLIHAVKYYDSAALGRWLGSCYAEEMATDGFLKDIDMLIPVPLHWRKRLARHYNQAAEIAQGISAVSGIPVADILTVRSHTSQTRLSRHQRLANVSAATYAVRRPDRIPSGANIAVVDDVSTTGATLSAVIGAILRDCPATGSVTALALGATVNY